MPTQDDAGVFREELVAHTHTHKHTQIGSPKRRTSTHNRHLCNLFMQTKTITGNMWASRRIFMAPTEALRGHAPRSPSMTPRLLSFYFALSSTLYAFLLHSSNVSCVTACFFPVFGCFGCLEAMFCCCRGIQLSKVPHTATIRIDFFFGQPWKGKIVFNWFWFIMIVASSDTSLYSQRLGRYPLTKDCYSLVWSLCVCPCLLCCNLFWWAWCITSTSEACNLEVCPGSVWVPSSTVACSSG